MKELYYLGIVFCLSQSAMFSGLNLAFFAMDRLQLEVLASGTGKKADNAKQILSMRQDANFLLTTILWGNVGINVLLTLLSDSVMTGVVSFLFSTVAITLFGEIGPQAYFSRNALKMASILSPVLRFYQYLLWPVAKPSAWILDSWLGKEGITYLREKEISTILRHHVEADEAHEVDFIEGIGAMNFLAIDDIHVGQEGEIIDPLSIIELQSAVDLPLFPDIRASAEDAFVQRLHASKKAWAIITDLAGEPRLVMDVDGFLRALFMDSSAPDPYSFCHRPIVVTQASDNLGDVILRMKRLNRNDEASAPLAKDIVLVWLTNERRIITGADVLGRLLKGVDKKPV